MVVWWCGGVENYKMIVLMIATFHVDAVDDVDNLDNFAKLFPDSRMLWGLCTI